MTRDEREQIVTEHMTQVRLIASRVFSRGLPPTVSFDDLVGEGCVGLLQAIDGFDAGKGLKLATYAEYRIRGAMLDHLRQLGGQRRRKDKPTLDPIRMETLNKDHARILEAKVEHPIHNLIRDQRLARLSQAMNRLTPRQRDVIVLRFQGLNGEQIAGKLCVSRSRVSEHSSVAVSRLKTLMKAA